MEARKYNRETLLDKVRDGNKENNLTLNIVYHPSFSRLRNILSEIHLLLTPDQEHRKVFSNIPIVGFRNGKILKSILVRAKLPAKNSGEGSCGKCLRRNCGVCDSMKCASTFSDKDLVKTYNVKSATLNCDSSMLVYIIQCKTCKLQYVGSTTYSISSSF